MGIGCMISWRSWEEIRFRRGMRWKVPGMERGRKDIKLVAARYRIVAPSCKSKDG